MASEYTRSSLAVADALFLPVVTGQYDTFQEKLLEDLRRSGKEVSRQAIFLPFVDFIEAGRPASIVYYNVVDKNAVVGAQSYAVVEGVRRLGSKRELWPFLAQLKPLFKRIVLIMQLGPRFKYDHAQFLEPVCVRRVNCPELPSIKQLEGMGTLAELIQLLPEALLGKYLTRKLRDAASVGLVVALSTASGP